ncbi:hypothetical protein AB0H43_22200 [Hamadaea sp. NPDC050747]|uniref:hypothetical protein n=1 Tax=Hamadaea sp. NPDC050747 TaxID=3155789 RepID=UPI0033DA384E
MVTGRLCLAVAVSAGLALAPAAAYAGPAAGHAPSFSSATFGAAKGNGATTTVAEQYAASRADQGRGKVWKDDFIAAAARNGQFYDPAFVDYLRFDRADGERVDVVVPRNFKITDVELGAGVVVDEHGTAHYEVRAASHGVEALGATDALTYPNGPGFDTFSSWSSGSYRLTTSRGKLDAFWYKLKDTGESNGTYDWWAYKRKGVATPSDITGFDDDVKTMGQRSYPTSSTRNILRGWVDWAPGIGSFTGGCGSTSVSLSAYGTGISYTPCETYQVDWNSNSADAGDFSVNWTNSNMGSTDGAVEMADVVVVKSTQGSVPVYNDYQYVNFMADDLVYEPWPLWPPTTAGCGSTNSSATC